MRNLWILVLALIGCSDHPYDPDAPAVDPSAPVVHITSPRRGTFAGDVRTLLVSGTASDDVRVVGVEVNGVDAVLAGDGTWTATVPLATGTQLIHAIARDAQGNVGKETRAVVAGPMQPIAMQVPRAITAAMSTQTFAAIGRGVTQFLRTGNVEAVIAPFNPVIDVGGGPDCLYAKGAITRIAVGPATAVSLTPKAGGLALDIELDQVALGMHLDYAALCLDGSRDISATASHIRLTGTLSVGMTGSEFDIRLVSPDVRITGLSVDLGGLPDEIVAILDLESALASLISWAGERFVVPLLNTALDGLNDTRTVDVLGKSVDIRVAPARIRVDAGGAVIELDTTLRARGDTGSPGYVYVANQLPAMTQGRGFELAIADDAANQLLGSFWAAKGMDKAFDLSTGSYGQIGKLYDRVELSAQLPPFVDATGGALKLTIGDLMATFKNGALTATQVAINAEVELKVVSGADGKPRLDVGTPTTYVDVLDENVDGANALSNAQFEVVTSFALGRVIAVGSGSVGAIPLPSFGGVAVGNVAITEQTGYLVLDGDIQ